MTAELTIIGAGLAGSEAAWQAAQRGVHVKLYEMRPVRRTPMHQTDRLAELVCSNSLGSNLPDRALGLLKNEMRRLGSLNIACADATAVPAGGALAVGREAFSDLITQQVSSHPNISLIRAEMLHIPNEGVTLVATGPLTSDALTEEIMTLCGQRYLYFYDAMAPIVTLESVNLEVAWRQSRYDRDSGLSEGDYINCPLNEEQYNAFIEAVNVAPKIELRDFELGDERYFEGCLPIDVLAARDRKALAFGPMQPVGLRDPRTGKRPYAVVQLRQDNLAGTLYNLVGFQTNIRWGEQKQILRMIPGLENADFVRLGQMHRNTFINSPTLLEPSLQFRTRPNLFFAGQITGTEGYVGSSMGGLIAGVNAVRLLQGEWVLPLPETTMCGALLHYITHAEPKTFQPMKANFGLMPELMPPVRNKRERYAEFARRALAGLEKYMTTTGWQNLAPDLPAQMAQCVPLAA